MKPSTPAVAAGLTDRGRQRAKNEDGFICDPGHGLYAVADGLGGLPKGDLASKLALHELAEEIAKLPRDAEPDWQEIFTRLNKTVVKAGQKHTYDGIGTTLTAMRECKGRLVVGHLGDSGLFVFSPDGSATQATIDHTMAQEMIDTHGGDIAQTIPENYYHTLTQCIGQHGEHTGPLGARAQRTQVREERVGREVDVGEAAGHGVGSVGWSA